MTSKITELNSICQENEILIKNLTEDIDNSVQLKTSLQNDLIKKFLVLLNSKKRRIADLESEDATLPIITMSSNMMNSFYIDYIKMVLAPENPLDSIENLQIS